MFLSSWSLHSVDKNFPCHPCVPLQATADTFAGRRTGGTASHPWAACLRPPHFPILRKKHVFYQSKSRAVSIRTWSIHPKGGLSVSGRWIPGPWPSWFVCLSAARQLHQPVGLRYFLLWNHPHSRYPMLSQDIPRFQDSMNLTSGFRAIVLTQLIISII